MILIKQYDTQKVQDCCEFGELLRDYCFVPDAYGGTKGCYSTFELRPEFKEVDKKSATGKKLLKHLGYNSKGLKLSKDEEWLGWQKEMYGRCKLFSNGNIHVGWWWDGDGTLVIIEGKRIAVNYDCKNDYEWEWLKS